MDTKLVTRLPEWWPARRCYPRVCSRIEVPSLLLSNWLGTTLVYRCPVITVWEVSISWMDRRMSSSDSVLNYWSCLRELVIFFRMKKPFRRTAKETSHLHLKKEKGQHLSHQPSHIGLIRQQATRRVT
jgi:hypothetical protein